MAICEVTGKKAVFGSKQKHRRGVAGKRWKKRVTATPRLFKPNLQTITITDEKGHKKQMTVSTKVIKRIKFDREQASLG
ncbi:hypothetical protein A2801_00990 [Candidatus Woesebacteria bacterium RIFCSPHIGHO2_01_FULL_41_10]|uniref:50S ribosomal protein L28 n=1 Tax=Candidatus Woesebacteria bacterium RIFCSPHIGHO2_01_FULL_41_10 TaxID=1802500 RepID=A0A1F7YRT2_9BACT|nr:MAG: hypothetical protein A2801_00990 [Candidatus Woesebacteria bacterium RIFCSPHIGHO2_01_FULL_41_10]